MKILSLIVAFVGLSFLAQAQKATEVSHLPYFAGCTEHKEGSADKRNASNQKIIEFVSNNLVYPDSAKAVGVEGTVYLRFTVNKAGFVENPVVLYDIGYGCGQEAMRLVNSMPRWEPAKKDGLPVAVSMEMPVRFEFVSDTELPGYRLVWGDLDADVVSRKHLRRLLREPVQVISETGDEVDMLELKVSIVRRNKIMKERLSDGHFSTRQKRMVRWIWPKSILVLEATVQQKGKFYYIQRELQLGKENR